MNCKITVLTLIFAASSATSSAAGDRHTALLDSIESHNTTLAALRSRIEVTRLEGRADLRLPDPEVSLDLLMDSPGATYGRTDVSISQQLDWGTLSGRRRKVVGTTDALAAAQYDVERRRLRAEAGRAVVTAIYTNRLCAELSARTERAATLVMLYEKKEARGDADALQMNRVRLSHSLAMQALRRAEAERTAARAELRRLNGGRELALPDTLYDLPALPSEDALLTAAGAGSAEVRAAEASVADSKARLRLSQSEGWPALSVGFMGEYTDAEKYSGLSLGLTLPLWGASRGRVRQQQAAVTTAELEAADVRTRLAATVRGRYAEAVQLQAAADRLRADLDALGTADLLRRAYDKGALSLQEYLLELSLTNEARTEWLQAERDAALAASDLLTLLP